MSWDIPPTAFTKEVTGDVNKAIRKGALGVLRNLTITSPVDTGRFKGNWLVRIGMKPKGISNNLDPSGASTLQSGATVISFQSHLNGIWISNNLPYALRLERGWSEQAPTGMLAQSLAAGKRAAELP